MKFTLKRKIQIIFSLFVIVHAYFAFMELLLVIMFFIMKLMIYNSFLLFLHLTACLIIRKKGFEHNSNFYTIFLFSSAFTCCKTIFSGIEPGDWWKFSAHSEFELLAQTPCFISFLLYVKEKDELVDGLIVPSKGRWYVFYSSLLFSFYY